MIKPAFIVGLGLSEIVSLATVMVSTRSHRRGLGLGDFWLSNIFPGGEHWLIGFYVAKGVVAFTAFSLGYLVLRKKETRGSIIATLVTVVLLVGMSLYEVVVA